MPTPPPTRPPTSSDGLVSAEPDESARSDDDGAGGESADDAELESGDGAGAAASWRRPGTYDWSDEGVPDAVIPDDFPDDYPDDGDVFLGEEAVVPQGEYDHVTASLGPDQMNELHELERRLSERGTPAFPIEQRRRVPFPFVWSRWRAFAMRRRSDVVDDFGRDPVYNARFDPLLELLYSRYFRVSTEGLEHVPASGAALLVANRSGTLPWDAAMLMHAIRRDHPARRDVRPLVEDFVFHFPYLGTILNRIGAVRACQENAVRLLAQQQLIAVFPEGQKGVGKLYRDRYQLQRFGRGGFVKLALRTRAPLIPVAIVGAEETNPMLAKVTWFAKSNGIPFVPITPTGLLPLPVKWSLRFGAPIALDEYGPEAADDRLLVNRLAELVRAQIQEMIDGSLARRKSVFFG